MYITQTPSNGFFTTRLYLLTKGEVIIILSRLLLLADSTRGRKLMEIDCLITQGQYNSCYRHNQQRFSP